MPRPLLRRLPFSSAGREAGASSGNVLWTLAAAACIALLAGQAAAQVVSSAETLLFETDHLARIKPPAVLVYEFRKVSNIEPGFSDKVQLDLAASKGKTSATLHFLSGAHKHDIPALEEAHGNPILLGFLERDIAEMKRLTGGSTAYFRKRIRMALAEGAQVSAQSIRYQGKSLPAQAVRIQPYLNDPMHARFESYVHKTYVFVVSEQVPGGIYQVRSSLDNGNGKAAAAIGPASAGTSTAPAKGAPAAGAAPDSTAPAPRPGQPVPAIDETLTLVSVTQPGH
ncbi:hypothetical protein [Massilia phyllosphaerae]|uniref:hypothetical protein n=1 Tax=Massilia phyllosphaerae TaxID=3106034 RepID=UPI002B1CDB29|nr:hypothetical protein [Massilia sp. SGZ-792]